MEPLPQASEGDEGLAGEAARGHLAVGLLVLPRRTLAHEPSGQPVDAFSAVLADAGDALIRRHIQLAVLACENRGDVRESCATSVQSAYTSFVASFLTRSPSFLQPLLVQVAPSCG